MEMVWLKKLFLPVNQRPLSLVFVDYKLLANPRNPRTPITTLCTVCGKCVSGGLRGLFQGHQAGRWQSQRDARLSPPRCQAVDDTGAALDLSGLQVNFTWRDTQARVAHAVLEL